MTTHGFIGRGMAVGTAIALERRMRESKPSTITHSPSDGKYGRITVGDARHAHLGGKIRCFVDGREVTDVAFDANDREGWAKVYKRDGTGILCGPDRKPIHETLYGDVRFEIA